MNLWYRDGNNPKADADNQQERSYCFDGNIYTYMAPPKTQKPLPKPSHPYFKRMQRMKRKELNQFVAGFIDGEGTFCVSLSRQTSRKYKKGWKWIINPLFQAYQHEDHIDILYLLRDHVFQTGRIHRKSSPYQVFTYSVENRTTLQERIVPFFSKHRLATKEQDFATWSKIIQHIYNKDHLTLDGFKNIVELIFTMNKNGKQRKYSKEYIFETLPEQFKQ